MTPESFAKIGEALYGPSWRGALAQALDVSERTVRRWADGEFTIPARIAGDLSDLCLKQSDYLLKLAKQLGNH